MFVPIIFKDTNFHIYKINEKCEVMKNDELLSEDDYIYHSTNGYDYILIEKLDGSLTMYPLDQVVYNSFYPDTQNIYEHFKCIHIDGNLRNNNLYNLECIKDVEEWRVVTYPGVKENTYEVSSYGNIKQINNPIHRAKCFDKFKKYYQIDIRHKNYRLHRIVAHEFLYYDGEWNTDLIINHIDNNGLNNNIMNLEIVTTRQNLHHAMLIGVCSGNNIRTDEMIKTFCELYVKYEGNIKKVKCDLKALNLIEYFGDRRISQIIRKERWANITDKYFKLGDYKLPNKGKLTEKEIRRICELIAKHKGLVSKVLCELQLDDNNRINENDIKQIRYKYKFTEISDEYFFLDDFEQFKLQINEVIEICMALIKYNFSVHDTESYFKSINKTKYNKTRIGKIKYKSRFAKISDKYFIKDKNGNFIILYNEE